MLSDGLPTGRGVRAEEASEVLIEAREVIVDYDARGHHHRALDGVSLAIKDGEAVGLIGESGSGKTTLAHSLLGLRRPTQGQILHRGRDVYALRNAERFRMLGRETSIVFQDPGSSLNPRLSVARVLRDPLHVHAIGSRAQQRDKVFELLQSVGLAANLAKRPVRALSGGQLQRVALARALAVEPSLLIADEPTSALDVSVQAQILNLIQGIRKVRQLTLLVVSHDIRVIRFLADRIAVMHNGEIVEQGPTEGIYNNPQHPYTKSLLAAAPKLRAGRASAQVIPSGMATGTD